MSNGRPWTDAELEVLTKGHEKLTIYEMLEMLGGGRTKHTVYGKLGRMGLNAKRLRRGSTHRKRGGWRPRAVDPDPEELERRVRPFRSTKMLEGEYVDPHLSRPLDRTVHKGLPPGWTDE